MKVIHHGGKNTVTGSCHEFFYSRHHSLLIDCGQSQGKDSQPLAVDFPIHRISAVIVTHAHIDHVGRIPWLIAAGYSGPIYCTPATAELLPLMLDDGLKLQLGMSKNNRESILALIRKRTVSIAYGRWHRISAPSRRLKELNSNEKPYCYIRFSPAGHILGSAYVEIKQSNTNVTVFSGDLGVSNTALLPDPIQPQKADYLFIESTYADRVHEAVDTRAERLKEIINCSLQNGGTILIPAFSVGRTQELLFDIEQLIFQSGIDATVPIILDSPMAQKVTQFYRRFKKLWGEEAKAKVRQHRHPLAFEQCITIEDFRSHQRLVNRLAKSGEMAIVVAASGMCQGGRIVGYLKALLSDPRTDVIFAGYQASDTLGRELQSLPAGASGNKIWIENEQVEVNAQIHTLSGYSAHADKHDLHSFIDGIAIKPKQIHLIHGEKQAQRQFAMELREKGFNVIE
ncbi:MBL fold metallo-hydrolase [Vibrio sp. TH_r3]|uniref:MBL fold metallo-hydrolase n=1 Tax=Vibrio sp. TH_r3 TaxID=3082084 RepID=UPI002954C7D1|nr:MBL fold metallo-hydrolase [Vibrio sp. TH_r3]MDV7104221.1 MBL fold metallo-hydrolase [Vibrio sp. TH_r3]